MSESTIDLAWRVGGPQGSGVDTAARLFAQACALGGFNVLGRREYYSNIKGRHSYFDIRVSEKALTSHRETVDLLTTFEEETLARHAVSVEKDGAIVYDVGKDNVALADITFLDERARKDMEAYLEGKDLDPTTGGLLQAAQARGVKTYGVSFDQILDDLTEELEIAKGLTKKMLNVVGVSISTVPWAMGRTRSKRRWSASSEPAARWST